MRWLGYTFEPANNGNPRDNILYVAYQNDCKKMFDASIYSDKVQEEKKNEFVRLLTFLGAKTVIIDNGSRKATAVDIKVGATVGIDSVMTAGVGAGYSANAAENTKFKVHIVTGKADKDIEKLRNFIEEEKCEAPSDLVPFFEGKKYMFIKEESTWQQMAYSRIKSDQVSAECSVTYETTEDSTLSANAAFLAGAFSVEAVKHASKARNTTVTYKVIFHDVAGSTAGPVKSPPSESEKSGLTRASSPTSEKMGPSTRASFTTGVHT